MRLSAANILFGPHLYPWYIKWQMKTMHDPAEARCYPLKDYISLRNSIKQAGFGNLPNAEIFKAFRDRTKADLYTNYRQNEPREGEKRRQDTDTDTETCAPSGLIVAKLCGHTIHPEDACQAVDICPVCIMHQCVESLERIARVWRLLGYPHQRPAGGLQLDLYLGVKKIWHIEKMRWANLVFSYNKFSALEREGEEKRRASGTETPEVVRLAASYTAALKVATQAPLLVEGWEEVFVPLERKNDARADRDEELEPLYSLVCTPEPSSDEFSSEPPKQCEEPALASAQHTQDQTTGITQETQETSNATPPPHTPSSSSSSSSSSSRLSTPPSQLSSEYILSPAPPPSSSDSPPTPRKGVTFADTTADNPTPRPPRNFRRTSLVYIPGRHVCPAGSVYRDTSFFDDDWYDVWGPPGDEESEEEDPSEEEVEGDDADADEDEFDLEDEDFEHAVAMEDFEDEFEDEREREHESSSDRESSDSTPVVLTPDSTPDPTPIQSPTAVPQSASASAHSPTPNQTTDTEQLQDSIHVRNSLPSRRRSRDEIECAEEQQQQQQHQGEESATKRRCL